MKCPERLLCCMWERGWVTLGWYESSSNNMWVQQQKVSVANSEILFASVRGKGFRCARISIKVTMYKTTACWNGYFKSLSETYITSTFLLWNGKHISLVNEKHNLSELELFNWVYRVPLPPGCYPTFRHLWKDFIFILQYVTMNKYPFLDYRPTKVKPILLHSGIFFN